MVASRQSQPLFSSDDTLEIIRSRIHEKRLFEARFLCRKLGRELTAEDRASLELQLANALNQVEQLRKEARGLVARGAYEPARELYSRLEAIAIDVPGVSEEIKALEGAEALAARLAKAVRPVQEAQMNAAPDPAPPVGQRTAQEVLMAQPDFFRRQNIGPRFYWLAGFVGAGLCLLIALILYGRTGDKPYPPPPSEPSAPRISGSDEAIAEPQPPVTPLPLQPAVPQAPAPEKVVVKQQPSIKKAEQSDSAVNPSAVQQITDPLKKPVPASSPPSLNLGGLQVQ